MIYYAYVQSTTPCPCVVYTYSITYDGGTRCVYEPWYRLFLSGNSCQNIWRLSSVMCVNEFVIKHPRDNISSVMRERKCVGLIKINYWHTALISHIFIRIELIGLTWSKYITNHALKITTRNWRIIPLAINYPFLKYTVNYIPSVPMP